MADHILICAGDPSGDRHAARLVETLRARRPGLRVTALGGDHLKAVSNRFLYSLVGVGGFGFLEPIVKIPQLWSVLNKIKTVFKNDRPDLVIPVDYYGFNIHVAEVAQAAGIPVTYYISPQVWASRPGRIQRLAKAVNEMLVIFPFEQPLYEKAGVPVRFVGHPLLDRLPSPMPSPLQKTIGLLPGSRQGTIQRHLPVQLGAAELLRKQFPDARFIMFRPAEIPESFYSEVTKHAPWIELSVDADYAQRRSLSAAITVSGTSALENMLFGTPMVIMYKLSAITYQIAKWLIQVPYVGIPNLLAGRLVVPELLQDQATPENLAAAVNEMIKAGGTASALRNELLGLRNTLQDGGTATAADEIMAIAGAKR